MQLFEIEGKEYELKLDFKSVKHLNGMYQGGAMEVIGKAMLQDIELFTRVVHAALFHTGQNFSFKTVEEAIEAQFNAERLTADSIKETLNQLVLEHFFYRPLLEKLKASDKKMSKALEAIM